MSRVPLPEVPNRTPDSESERRLAEIRREAEQLGVVNAKGITPAGAPFGTERSQPEGLLEHEMPE